MWQLCGDIDYTCKKCGNSDLIPISDFSNECFGGSERGVGEENLYELSYEFDCFQCRNPISLKFEASEYPVECLNFVLNKPTGAGAPGDPDIEYLREIVLKILYYPMRTYRNSSQC